MTSSEEQFTSDNSSTLPGKEGGELLQHVEKQQESSNAVTNEVDSTVVAVVGGLWNTFIPADEIEKLMEMRAENDNTDTEKKAA